MNSNIFGVSAFYHASAACLIRDGHIVATAQEKRVSQKKFDACFVQKAGNYCTEGVRYLRRIRNV